jgi:hypothetical protein
VVIIGTQRYRSTISLPDLKVDRKSKAHLCFYADFQAVIFFELYSGGRFIPSGLSSNMLFWSNNATRSITINEIKQILRKTKCLTK